MTAIPRPSSGEGRRNRFRALSQHQQPLTDRLDGTRWRAPSGRLAAGDAGAHCRPPPERNERRASLRGPSVQLGRMLTGSSPLTFGPPSRRREHMAVSPVREQLPCPLVVQVFVRTALAMTAESTVPARTRRSAMHSAAWEQAAYAVAVLAVTVSIHARYMRLAGTRLPGSDMVMRDPHRCTPGLRRYSAQCPRDSPGERAPQSSDLP